MISWLWYHCYDINHAIKVKNYDIIENYDIIVVTVQGSRCPSRGEPGSLQSHAYLQKAQRVLPVQQWGTTWLGAPPSPRFSLPARLPTRATPSLCVPIPAARPHPRRGASLSPLVSLPVRPPPRVVTVNRSLMSDFHRDPHSTATPGPTLSTVLHQQTGGLLYDIIFIFPYYTY
jgi:hypothetical protein